MLGLVLATLLTGQRADAQELPLGRPVTAVHVETADGPITEAAVLELVETRAGEPLSLVAVRQTIDHFVGLGRFEDIRVAATDQPSGVTLRYLVVPVDHLDALRVTGTPTVPADVIRERLADRFGPAPSASLAPDLVRAVEALHAERGYPAARVTLRVLPGDAPGRVTGVLAVVPGPRLTVGEARVEGVRPTDAAGVLARLDLAPGRPLDRQVLQSRTEAFEDTLRGDGFYEARVTADVTPDTATSTADVTVSVERGRQVRLRFDGDVLPRDLQDTLVPVRRERSVDQEVLEDGSRNIERHLQAQGYRQAEAPWAQQADGEQLTITFTVRRGLLHRLDAVELRGPARVPATELAPLVTLVPGSAYDESRVGAVAAAVTEFYRVRGFTGVTVMPRVSTGADRRDGSETVRPVRVVIDITEGPQTLVGPVTLRGADTLPESDLRALTTLVTGAPFYRPQLQADRDALEGACRRQGYQRCTVEARIALREENRVADVEYVLAPGPQARIDHVLVTGARRVRPALVRRESGLVPGRPLGYDTLLDAQQRLSALGLFRRVRITELPHGGSGVSHDVLLEVAEAPATSFSYGGGLEVGRRLRRLDGGAPTERLDAAPRAYVELSRRNLWGKNRAVSLLTSASLRAIDPAADAPPGTPSRFGLNQYRVLGTFREPRLFDGPGDAQITAFLERGLRSSFTFDRIGARAEYARRFASRLTATGRYRFDSTTLSNEQIAAQDQLLVDRLFPQVRLSTLSAALLRDSRDDVLDPLRGTVLGVDGELALRSFGSEVGFGRTFLQAFAYRRVPGTARAVLATGARIGLARAINTFASATDPSASGRVPITSLPASERFFAGGDTTVRGFALDRLGATGTLDASGFPTGGNGLLVLNVELRSPAWKGVGGVAFVDAGNVFLRAGDMALADLRTAAGAGLRYKSPIGPLRLDVGFALDRARVVTATRERRAVLHISLGQAF